VENAQEVTLPSGVTYTDLRIGGGQMASRGLLIILDLKLWADGELIQVCCHARTRIYKPRLRWFAPPQ
jgi:hypothetical protein